MIDIYDKLEKIFRLCCAGNPAMHEMQCVHAACSFPHSLLLLPLWGRGSFCSVSLFFPLLSLSLCIKTSGFGKGIRVNSFHLINGPCARPGKKSCIEQSFTDMTTFGMWLTKQNNEKKEKLIGYETAFWCACAVGIALTKYSAANCWLRAFLCILQGIGFKGTNMRFDKWE